MRPTSAPNGQGSATTASGPSTGGGQIGASLNRAVPPCKKGESPGGLISPLHVEELRVLITPKTLVEGEQGDRMVTHLSTTAVDALSTAVDSLATAIDANPSCSTLPRLPGKDSSNANPSFSTPPELPGGGSSSANISRSTLPELPGMGPCISKLNKPKIGRRSLWANRWRARKSIAKDLPSIAGDLDVVSESVFINGSDDPVIGLVDIINSLPLASSPPRSVSVPN